MTKHYDVAVIGSGPGGGGAARALADAGKRVAVAEVRDYGGVCPNWGCNPKKILVQAAEVVDRARRMRGKGLPEAAATAGLDWPELKAFKDSLIDPIAPAVREGLAGRGIDCHDGPGRFTGTDGDRLFLEFAGAPLTADHAVVATGVVCKDLPFPGNELLATSDDFMLLEDMPQRLAFIGGGFIAFELAHTAARAGAQVTILHHNDQPLKQFDPDLVALLLDATRQCPGNPIGVRLSAEVKAARRTNEGLELDLGGETLCVDMAFNAAGKTPALEGLGLEAAGVRRGPRGVEVDGHMRSVSNPRVFAVGDCAATPYMLTPTGDLEGKAAADAILGRAGEPLDYTGVPYVVFTLPPLGAAGLSEVEARERHGEAAVVRFKDTSASFSARKIGHSHAGFKLIAVKPDKRLVGAHVLGHGAEEVANLLGMAVRLGLGLDELRRALWAYPTACYDVKHMLEAFEDEL